ncbi:MAG: bifunctional phosphoribosylaminoimidazolecarboxamide formyltransferase/IMP cyclohydrolase [Bacteroidia bacterium]|nr:bifunctional phosphoribosylaminoimidazolecarboxamide formyltransferase/IMP cyclohydrolase [Bacteroidia bacterium]
MTEPKKIRSALISVYHKQGLDLLVTQLIRQGVVCYSTGGTAAYLQSLGADTREVEDLTGYPSILGGRVKTLHPKVHGGILARRAVASDQEELSRYDIPEIDLVVVDLYPFEETVAAGAADEDIIEKIDIGGIALIRGAAKNFEDVVCVPSRAYYQELADMLAAQDGTTSLAQRRYFAGKAFGVSSYYDTLIHRYFEPVQRVALRYGENPHQQGWFEGDLAGQFERLNGKELSYNNLVDIAGALELVDEFTSPVFAIIKHTNACGCAIGADLGEAWTRALSADPVSAFGGVLACNGVVTAAVARQIDEIFFEVLIATGFEPEALEILCRKKNRIILRRVYPSRTPEVAKTLLGGRLIQTADHVITPPEAWVHKTSRPLTDTEQADALLGDIICKHLKSNAIALVKGGQLIGSGVGQTSRIDALRQAIQKAHTHGFTTEGAVLASDAFFPFADSVATAWEHGIRVVIEPGGSVRDEETITFCETHEMSLIFTGTRHFKH